MTTLELLQDVLNNVNLLEKTMSISRSKLKELTDDKYLDSSTTLTIAISYYNVDLSICKNLENYLKSLIEIEKLFKKV